MTELAKHSAFCVDEIIPHLREQVEHVEKLRGAGPDAKLRYLMFSNIKRFNFFRCNGSNDLINVFLHRNPLRQLEENIRK